MKYSRALCLLLACLLALTVALMNGVVNGVGPRIFKYRTDRLQLSPDSHPDNFCELVNGVGSLAFTPAMCHPHFLLQ